MPVDIEAVRKKLAESSSLGFQIYKPKYGPGKDNPAENRVKLLSWPPQGGQLAKRVLKHFNLGSDGRSQAICPKTTGVHNPCPICDFCDSAARTEDATMLARAKKLGQVERFEQLLIDWDAYEKFLKQDKEGKKEISIYDCPPKIHRNVMQTMASEDHDFTDFESSLVSLVGYAQGPGNPKAIDFKVTLEKMKPKIVKIDIAEWADLIPKLDDILKPLPLPKLQALLDGKDADEATAKEEDPKWAEEGDATTTDTEEEAATETESTPPAETKSEVEPVAKVEEAKPAPVAAVEAKPKANLQDLIARAKAAKK